MKKIIVLVVVALLLMVGCGSNSADLELENSGHSGAYLTDEDVHLIYQRAFEALSWFNLTTMPGEWLGMDGGVEMYGSTFDIRVVHDRIRSLADLRTYLMEIFIEDFVDRLFADYVYGGVSVRFIDVDGVLHTFAADRGTNAMAGEIRSNIIQQNADKIIYQVSVDIHDLETPWEERSPDNAVNIEETNFVLINVNGTWLFTDFRLVVDSQAKPNSSMLVGYILIDNGVLYLDKVDVFVFLFGYDEWKEQLLYDSSVISAVEIIAAHDVDRLAKFGLTDDDMRNWHHIRQLGTRQNFYLTYESVFTFHDFRLPFEPDPIAAMNYTTTSIDEFLRHLYLSGQDAPGAYNLLFFIEVSDGRVIRAIVRKCFFKLEVLCSISIIN